MASDAPKALNTLGQSLWLDNITRNLLDSGTLKRYIDDLSVTGLTSNPTIFDNAISRSSWYDAEIRKLLEGGVSGEELFFKLAVQDLSRAADLFRPVYDRTGTVDGFVSLEVSPVFAYDTNATVEQAKTLHAQANKPNLFIKIPGTPEGLPAIEDSIFAGVPVNVTLLFSTDQYKAAADAYMKVLFASTGTKDKTASDTLYIAGLAAPNTVNTMPEETLLAFADHGKTASALSRDGGDFDAVLAAHVKAGIDLTALSTQLQSEGAKGFVKSWNELLGAIESKSKVLA
jgi:transaldolase